MERQFKDRRDAGRVLAKELSGYSGRPDLLVLALPRGGVPVGLEIALALDAPLDVFVVRKLGVPGHEELALGAIATGDVRVLNEPVVNRLGISDEVVARVASQETKELQRREQSYRRERGPLEARGKTVILVDDGLATGSTMRAAISALRAHEPERIVVAVPVGAASTCAQLASEVDEMVCALAPDEMTAISMWYEDFSQTSDDDVRDLLTLAQRTRT